MRATTTPTTAGPGLQATRPERARPRRLARLGPELIAFRRARRRFYLGSRGVSRPCVQDARPGDRPPGGASTPPGEVRSPASALTSSAEEAPRGSDRHQALRRHPRSLPGWSIALAVAQARRGGRDQVSTFHPAAPSQGSRRQFILPFEPARRGRRAPGGTPITAHLRRDRRPPRAALPGRRLARVPQIRPLGTSTSWRPSGGFSRGHIFIKGNIDPVNTLLRNRRSGPPRGGEGARRGARGWTAISRRPARWPRRPPDNRANGGTCGSTPGDGRSRHGGPSRRKRPQGFARTPDNQAAPARSARPCPLLRDAGFEPAPDDGAPCSKVERRQSVARAHSGLALRGNLVEQTRKRNPR